MNIFLYFFAHDTCPDVVVSCQTITDIDFKKQWKIWIFSLKFHNIAFHNKIENKLRYIEKTQSKEYQKNIKKISIITLRFVQDYYSLYLNQKKKTPIS